MWKIFFFKFGKNNIFLILVFSYCFYISVGETHQLDLCFFSNLKNQLVYFSNLNTPLILLDKEKFVYIMWAYHIGRNGNKICITPWSFIIVHGSQKVGLPNSWLPNLVFFFKCIKAGKESISISKKPSASEKARPSCQNAMGHKSVYIRKLTTHMLLYQKKGRPVITPTSLWSCATVYKNSNQHINRKPVQFKCD